MHSPHRDYLAFAFMDWQRAIRMDRYKLIEYCVNGQRHTQLFNLEKDPHETKDLANEENYLERLFQMREQLRIESKRLNDGNTPSDFTTKMGASFWQTYHGKPTP